MAVQLGGGKYIGLVSQETEKYESLWTQIELENQIKFSRECQAEAKKYAANKYGEYIPYMSIMMLVICGCQCKHDLYLCKVCGHVRG